MTGRMNVLKTRIFIIIMLIFYIVNIFGCNFSFSEEKENDIKSTTQFSREDIQNIPQKTKQVDVKKELRGIWITYNELSMIGSENLQKDFEVKIEEMFTNIADFGFNTVFVHVRPFCDSFYKSTIFPWSAYLTGEQGKDPGFDPLQIMIEKAREKNLKIHAWINPYRISLITDTAKLAENNPARVWLEEDVYTRRILTPTGLYFNPASEEARKLIVDGVKEILENYSVDGIHFDDYFYPQPDTYIDETEYNVYKKKGGEMSQEEWRKNNVNLLIKEIYTAVKSINQDVLFGISPAGNLDLNENTLFADVKSWGSIKGYVDYLCPQLYFGFENKTCPFEKTADEWYELVSDGSVNLYAGLAAYKCGDEAEGEWAEHDDILARQIDYIRKIGKYNGFVMFSYSSMFSESAIRKNMTKELNNVTNLL